MHGRWPIQRYLIVLHILHDDFEIIVRGEDLSWILVIYCQISNSRSTCYWCSKELWCPFKLFLRWATFIFVVHNICVFESCARRLPDFRQYELEFLQSAFNNLRCRLIMTNALSMWLSWTKTVWFDDACTGPPSHLLPPMNMDQICPWKTERGTGRTRWTRTV